eukprot:gene7106-9580_t
MIPWLKGYLAIKETDDVLPNDPREVQTVVSEIRTNENSLSKKWFIVFPSVLLFYVILQTFMGRNDICDTKIEFPGWVERINFCILLWFVVNSCFTLYYFYTERNSNRLEHFSPLIANFTILVIAGSSSYLTLRYHWGGLCRDAF